MSLHALCRLTVAAALTAGVLTVTPSAAQAAYVEATLVATRTTSTWEIPSPDPSGITYDPANGRLVISDGEVEETPLYRGTNIFFSSLTGEQTPGSPGWTTQPWSDEPTGISYQTGSRTFVSDDDADKVFLVDPGADGVWTADADPAPEEFSVRPQQGDPEDVTVDMDTTNTGHLLVLDGVGAAVWEYGPGPNGVFDGAPASGGDDTAVSYDVSQYGALDPEGLEYHPGRNTILVVDASSETIYELDRQGALLNRIGIGVASPRKAAGMTLAPASDGSGAQNLYVVDRGVDNDFDPTQNDGRFYELALNFPPLGGVVNAGPTVDAGPDTAVQMPAAASLQGTVTDDGLPDPPAAVTTTWSKVSGTGTVTFGDPAATSTTASFSAPGTYVLRLTATDGEIRRTDDVVVEVSGADGLQVVDVPIRAGEDDAEERSSRTILDGNDLEMVDDVKTTNTTRQIVGLRFAGVPVPQGAIVTNAYVQFTAAEVNTDAAALSITGEEADDAAPFTTAAQSVSGRVQTAAVAWAPEPWSVRRAAGVENRTPDLSAVVQAIVDRSGWSSGNALALVVTGSGTRNAESYESTIALNAPVQPVLHLEFRAGDTAQNTAPVVFAGPDGSVEQPNAATLEGSVTDDGLPAGAVTAAWSSVSGPGTVTFADPAAASTTATFSAPGTYVLRLTGSDGELSSSDDVTVEVTEPVAEQPSGAVEVAVQSGVDDAEERSSSGAVNVSSRDLELGLDGSRAQTVGLRFAGVTLPEGVTVTNAYIQFQVDEVSTGAADLVIAGQAADDAGSFTTGAGNISTRERTAATVSWAPAGWSSANLRGPEQRTPNLASVVQEIVDRDGWVSGNALAFVVTGSGSRTAEAADSGITRAPVLRIEYGGDPGDDGTGETPGDGGGDGSDGATVTTLSVPVMATVDDAEERAGGDVRISSGDLNMAVDGTRTQTVGMRFAGVALPAGATIVSAYVQFQADEVDDGPADLLIAGQAADNALSFTTDTANVSSRPRTGAGVAWSPEAWTTVGLRGTAQQTPDLAAVVQEIVNRPGWASGNALALLVTGSGERAAESYDGGARKAPVLHIQYVVP